MPAKMMDGNRSDKIVNSNLLVDVAKKMKELGQNDPVYVADSALATGIIWIFSQMSRRDVAS